MKFLDMFTFLIHDPNPCTQILHACEMLFAFHFWKYISSTYGQVFSRIHSFSNPYFTQNSIDSRIQQITHWHNIYHKTITKYIIISHVTIKVKFSWKKKTVTNCSEQEGYIKCLVIIYWQDKINITKDLTKLLFCTCVLSVSLSHWTFQVN